jgi:hypothetical protein
LTLGAFCLTTGGAVHAAPLFAVGLPFVPSYAWLAPASAAPSSSPVPLAAPKPKPATTPAPRTRRSFLGDGPIVLKGTGTYQLMVGRSTRDSLATATDNYSTALSVVAERRTEQSALSVSNAFGYGTGGAAAGGLIVGYRTPSYGLTYGEVTGPADSQLQIGGIARGISLDFPVRNGDLSYIAGTAAQQTPLTTETFRVLGLRRDWNAFGGFLGLGAYYGAGEDGTGRETIGDVGFRRYGATLSTDAEFAVSSTGGIPGAADGARLASALQLDLQGKSTFTTLALKFDPSGFQSLTGAVDGGFSADLALRRTSTRFGDVNLELGHSDDQLDGTVQHDDRLTLSGDKSWSHVGFQYDFGIDGTQATSATALQRTGALTVTESIRSLSLFETLQATSTSQTSGFAAQRQVALGASRPLLGGSIAYQFSRSDSAGGLGSSGAASAQSLSFRRALGKKLDAQVTQAFQTSTNNGVAARLIETSVSLVRRLSNVVAVQVSADRFHQTGLGGGNGTTFSASLVGPFGFGEPAAGIGRANPNLPAVIRGMVTFSTSSSPFAYNAPTLRGFNNALIILDGRITQRTDSSGQFEFRFVSQGTHTIRIDSATISPGLIVDREYQTVSVLGGQTTAIQFNVGNFAGVSGVVTSQDSTGARHPLGNIGIAVDGIQAVTTTADGHYQVGRLSPGAHTIEIVESTVPSTVQFIADKRKTVTVTAGTSTPLNFVAMPLGSIAGTVLAPADGGFGAPVGLKNVYVLAEPGEHAVITDDDGSFLMDNIPPGSYTLSVDPDTIPDGLSVLAGPDGPVAIQGGTAASGVVFKLGPGAKNVVYTFSDAKRVPIQVEITPKVAPPGSLLRVSARTAAKDVSALFVESDVFGAFALRHDARTDAWIGNAVVPPLVKGDYALTVTAHRKDVTEAVALVPVDPRVQLFAARLSPHLPGPGQTAHVTLRSLAPVEEGDTILFEDGYKVALPKPRGHLFQFDIRVWSKGLPYSATVLTKRGPSYPIILR